MSTELYNTQPTIQLRNLQTRIDSLENQLEQTLAHSKQKEAFANTLASDLEHIITQLRRLEIIQS